MVRSISTLVSISLGTVLLGTLVLPAVVKPEVAANVERLLHDIRLELDLGLLLDFGRALRLALNSLRPRRSRACRFAHRAVVLPLPLRASGAYQAAVFQLPVQTWAALHAAVFPLAVRARFAFRAVAFHLPVGSGVAVRAGTFHPAVRAGGAVRATAFQFPVRAGVARRAVMLHAALGTRATVLALVFLPSVRAPLMSSHYSPPRARASALRAPQGAKTGVVVFLRTFPRSRHEIASEVQKSNNWTRLPLKPNSAVAYRSAHTCGRAAHLAFQDSAVYLRIARSCVS